MTNKLRIRAKSLNLDLVGEAEYSLRAYDAIHPVLVERFEESVQGVLDDPTEFRSEPASETVRRPSMSKTIPMHKPVDPQSLSEGSGGSHHINVVVCNEVYNKIYLVDREEIRISLFDKVLDLDRVNRIYINRSQRERFRGFFKFGKVLWRELTSAGKAVVKGG